MLAHDSRLVDTFVGGWRTNYIITHQSGQPVSVGCPVATSNFGCLANRVPGTSVYAAHRGPNQYLNPLAFAQPPAATALGQTGFSPLGGSPNQARGPGFTNVDFSVFKEFALTEVFRLQFRAETFNVFNNHSFGQPGNLNFNDPRTSPVSPPSATTLASGSSPSSSLTSVYFK